MASSFGTTTAAESCCFFQGDLTSRASSEYAASGYSTDEGMQLPPWNPDPQTDALQPEADLAVQMHQERNWDPALQGSPKMPPKKLSTVSLSTSWVDERGRQFMCKADPTLSL